MDVILEVADHLILNRVWAAVLPMPDIASTDPTVLETLNATTGGPSSLMSSLLSKLPSSLLSSSVVSALSTKAGVLSPSPASSSIVPSMLPPLAANLSAWPRDYVPRQLISVFVLTIIGINLLYFIFASASYYFIFDKRMMRHPRFLKDQIKLEIRCSVESFPLMAILTMPWFMGEVRGYSKLYANVEDYGWAYLLFSVPAFLVFTDFCIYWIHRWLHLPFLYKHIHKPHHKWIVPTPFASHAFHPVDGYSQSVPYHLFVFLFPMHRYLYLGLFIAVNFWSIFIHDSDMLVSAGSQVEKFINTPAHHTLHHLYFTCNYGQYFTWADRAGGSYRPPQEDLDPILEVLALDKSSAFVGSEKRDALVAGVDEKKALEAHGKHA